jgi:hypothetical protein
MTMFLWISILRAHLIWPLQYLCPHVGVIILNQSWIVLIEWWVQQQCLYISELTCTFEKVLTRAIRKTFYPAPSRQLQSMWLMKCKQMFLHCTIRSPDTFERCWLVSTFLYFFISGAINRCKMGNHNSCFWEAVEFSLMCQCSWWERCHISTPT